jgi:hypothetical protein
MNQWTKSPGLPVGVSPGYPAEGGVGGRVWWGQSLGTGDSPELWALPFHPHLQGPVGSNPRRRKSIRTGRPRQVQPSMLQAC